MRRCVIVAGGAYTPIGPRGENDYLIACDSGLRWCQREGIVPDLLLGDFDSYAGELPDGVPVLRFPVRKDDTDTMLAVRWAAENGFEEILLLCAFGGSLDHLLANLQTLHFACKAGLRASARDDLWTLAKENNSTIRAIAEANGLDALGPAWEKLILIPKTV